MESTGVPVPDIAFYTPADEVVLKALYRDIALQDPSCSNEVKTRSEEDEKDLEVLAALNDAKSPDFQPTVCVAWDYYAADSKSRNDISGFVLRHYVPWAKKIVRTETDVVFLTHIFLYFSTTVPSALYLFHSFSYLHAVAHLLVTIWYSGGFTLMMHNHIHNNGVLSKQYALFDFCFPYILEPLMGHTWDSYYYHHVKHHHVEGNGPGDLSSTIRYQRDSIVAFLQYEARFLLFAWIELPLYFMRRKKYTLAFKALFTELASYAFMFLLWRWKTAPTVFTLIIPFCILRIGLMIGNWGQHALVDEVEPSSDFRSSITLIDVPSNRFCFNDGYHTSHHLNPRRHWRDHPHAFLKARARYAKEGALVFHNIDYLEITYRLLTKNYRKLASQLVPMPGQIHLSLEERAEMLRRKTRAFTEEEIARMF
ncbi:hypothetical protein B7494_g2889 [Chlorociboria aeruginascens]|nr:hypothetical protein B7494_g2889 [Chlorociboria aeruginascens]